MVLATNEEKVGIEMVEEYLPSFREDLQRRRRRRDYWDLTGERGPDDGPGGDDAEREEEDASTRMPSEAGLPSEADQPRQVSSAIADAPEMRPHESVTEEPDMPEEKRRRVEEFPSVPTRVSEIEGRSRETEPTATESGARSSGSREFLPQERERSPRRSTEGAVFFNFQPLDDLRKEGIDPELGGFNASDDGVFAHYAEKFSCFYLAKAKKNDEIARRDISDQDWRSSKRRWPRRPPA